MKNILCLMKYYLNPDEAPPFPKFDYQMEALRNLGYNVWFMGIEYGRIYLCTEDSKEEYARIPLYRIPGIGRILTFNALYRATKKVFADSQAFDIAYIRMMPAIPPLGKALKAIRNSGCRSVMEFPTFPPEREEATETRLHRKLFIRVSKLYELRLARWFDLFSLIGTVQAETYRGIPAVNITNGISLESIPQRNYTSQDDSIHLLGVANIQMMNAFDRVINGIELYRLSKTLQEPDIHFHIVGPDRDGTREKLKQLVQEKNLQGVVHFEGPAFGNRLDAFFDTADVALGSLVLQRIGHTGIATLKAREYLAHGIPFITSGIDPVIPQNRSWCMNFPQDESPIDMRLLLRFVEHARKNPDIGTEMRDFAKEHLSWESQFLQVFEALEHVNSPYRRPS